MATKQTLTSGYGTGLTDKQKRALGFVHEPKIVDQIHSGSATADSTTGLEFVAAGAIGAPTPLSLDHTVSLVTVVRALNGNSCSLADGVLGQKKIIVHDQIVGSGNSPNMHIEPTNFANGTSIESDSAKRAITLLYDGDNWQVIAGEITGTEEMEIDA